MSIKEKAILVSLTISKPKLSEKDKAASRDVAFDKNAAQSAVAVVKKLYPKHLLDPITTAESAARNYLNSVTAPWASGLRLLPAMLWMPFAEKINEHKVKFEQEVTVFLNNAVSVLQEAAQQQGDLYDPSSYPDTARLRQQFQFKVAFYPVGTENDVLLNIEERSLNEARAEVERSTREAFTESAKAVYQRLYDAVARIHTQCSKEGGRIYDTLTGNLDELLIVLPALDMTENPAFASLCKDTRQSLTVSPEALRTVPGVRERTAAEAAKIMDAMKAFL